MEELVSKLIESRGLTHFRLAETEWGATRLYLHFNKYDPEKSLRGLVEVSKEEASTQMNADVAADVRAAWKRQCRFERLPAVRAVVPMSRFTPKSKPLPPLYIDAEAIEHKDFISGLVEEMRQKRVLEVHLRK